MQYVLTPYLDERSKKEIINRIEKPDITPPPTNPPSPIHPICTVKMSHTQEENMIHTSYAKNGKGCSCKQTNRKLNWKTSLLINSARVMSNIVIKTSVVEGGLQPSWEAQGVWWEGARMSV